MTSCDVPSIRISDPGELIEAIPYLIGFHPQESLVLIGFAGADSATGNLKRVQVGVRVDLPPPDVRPAELGALIEALTGSGVGAVVAVIVSDEVIDDPRGSDRWTSLASVLGEAIEAAGQVLLDLLVASAARWWSLACADLQCCPSEGKPRAVGCSLAAAEATVAGLVAYADRDEVAGQIAPLSDRERHRFEPDLADAEHRVTKALLDYGLERLRRADKTALFTELRRRSGDAAPPRRLTSKKLARFAVALTDIGLRDEVWLAIDEHSIQARDFLHELLTRLPPPYDAAPLFLFGWDQWRRGNGTLAAMAAERALESDSHYSAARLLLTAVRHGLDPRTTAPLREQT